MNLNEIDYASIDEDELDKIIFKECGVNDFFINQSTEAYKELKYMLTCTMLKNGIGGITSESDANKIINSIKESWIINENSVTSEPQESPQKESEICARDIEKYYVRQVKKLDDNTMQSGYSWYRAESDFSEEAQSLGYEDMPQILANGNRIYESISSSVYTLNPNGEDILNSKTYKGKYSTLSQEEFADFQNDLSKKTVQETINLPDDYFTYISKESYNNNVNLNDLVPDNIERTEKKQYTDEEFSRMTQNIMNRTELGTREQIMEEALRELGVSERLINTPKKQMLYDMVEESISNNGEISDLTNQTQIEQLLRQLNNDIVIKKDYLAWNMKQNGELTNKTSQRYGVNPNEVIRNDVMEFYIDNDGLYNTVQIASMYLGNIDSNVKTAMRERSYAMNNNEMELLTERDKSTQSITSLEEYNQSKLRDMDVDTGIAIKNKPNSMWEKIATSLMRPDIIISRMMQAGKNRVRENQVNSRDSNSIQTSTVISGNNSNLQQGPGYSNYANEVTQQDIQEAERLIATRSDAAKSGAVSQITENSEKVLDEVARYIEGDAETREAKATNEEERNQQAQETRTEDVTK